MRLDYSYPPNKKQHGSMLVLALFVMIILGLLGLSLTEQLRAGSQNVIYDVLGTRAALAAQSGMEHIASEAFPIGSTPVSCQTPIQVTQPSAFDTASGFEGCAYEATCNSRQITDANGEAFYYYQFTSTGTCQGGDLWTSRSLAQDGFIAVNP